MSAIFNFSSLVTALLLSICTTTYLRELRPTIFDGSVIDAAGTATAQVGRFESSVPAVRDTESARSSSNI
jgi:hypothetical protein